MTEPMARIIDVGGRRVLLALDRPGDVAISEGEKVGVGLVSK